MEAFIAKWGVEAIILFIIGFGIALKEVIELVKYFQRLVKERVKTAERDDDQDIKLEDLNSKLIQIDKKIDRINDDVKILQDSDKDAIKSWIVTLYHKYKKDPSGLDHMEMDLLERRYKHYKDEGGNSYVDDLMVELRNIYKNKET